MEKNLRFDFSAGRINVLFLMPYEVPKILME